MKTTITILITTLLLFGCKKSSDQMEQGEISSKDAAGSTAEFAPPSMSEIDFDTVLDLQLKIISQPLNRELRAEYLQNAYFKGKRALISIGIGRLRNPQTGTPISQAMAKRAAKMDAIRWATYGSSWISNELSPDFGKIDTIFQNLQTEMLTFNRGDSLYLAIASEVQEN